MDVSMITVLKTVPLVVLIILSTAVFLDIIQFSLDLFCFKLILVVVMILMIFRPGKGGLSSTDSQIGNDPQTSTWKDV